MSPAPLVSIIMPVFNDEATVATSIRSALAQTLTDIEVVCVDDASTDGTAAVIEQLSAEDARVRLVRHDRNLSALQARRNGILTATGDYVLFVDGDDELVPDAAQKALSAARATDADLVGFGVTVVEKDGRTGGAYECRLQPLHKRLEGTDVLQGLFPVGGRAQGQLWRYLFRMRVLREAYALLPQDLSLARVNDLPLMFLVAALATRYVSLPDRLYRYHFGRGGSGHDVDSIERAEFYVSAVRSVDSIRPAVKRLAAQHFDAQLLETTYDSVRLSIIGYVCFQLVDRSDSAVLAAALARLYEVASTEDTLRAAGRFYPSTLATLKFHTPYRGLDDRPVRTVLLATSSLRTGGVSAVLGSQARFLRDAGYRVVVVARSGGSDAAVLPDGVTLLELSGRGLVTQLTEWAAICREQAVDVVIDHQVLYTQYWPEFALMARAEGAATIGWIHNFVARPVYDGTDRLELIERCADTLAQLVALSPLDVSYLKLRGIEHTAYLPNPPSRLLVEASTHTVTKKPPVGRIELVWWGRLEQHTKQVYELIEVGVQLRALDLEFRLRVIGPDWDDVTAQKFNARARRRGVGDQVAAEGPLHGRQLIDAIDAADAFVSTSIIEGYQLTIAEAQSRALPVFMYELPWLTLVQSNEGIVSVPQGDAHALARRISDVMSDATVYERLSHASTDAAHRALSHDFARLYEGVVAGTLPSEFSPQPTLKDAQQLLGLLGFFAGRARRPRAAGVDDASLGARLWRTAAPLGRATLTRFPGMRPLAHRAKKWLRLS